MLPHMTAHFGFRLHQRTARSMLPTGRARIGSPMIKRFKSSASSKQLA